GLADGFRHFARLAMTEADAAGAVTHHHQGGEAEAAATLHNLGDAIDVDQLVHQVAVFFLAVAATATAFAPATAFAALATTATATATGFAGFGRLLFVFVCHIRIPQKSRPASRAASAS